MPWNRRITLIADDVDRDFKQYRDKVILSTHRDLVLSSPVLTGRYRGNHMITVNRRSNSPNVNQFDKAGTRTLANGASVIVGSPTYAIVYVQNSLSYTGDLEKGKSPQAPEGVYRPAFRRLLARFND